LLFEGFEQIPTALKKSQQLFIFVFKDQPGTKEAHTDGSGLNLINENKDNKIIDGSSSRNTANNQASNFGSNAKASSGLETTRNNFQIFMNELLDCLRSGDAYAQSIYESILNQEKFLKSLNDVVKAVQREGGLRDKKVIKLKSFLAETAKNSTKDFTNLVNFESDLPLILDPNVKVRGIIPEKASMFKSNLMPCKFVFKTHDLSGQPSEYSVIYKIGDDLRQDQLVLQMISLMDNVRFELDLFIKYFMAI
jgi:hypothetical protein